ncbi:hypothetical protein TWF730_010032 [Orbilia blumenaviensis]|uniref:C2H2-type domain-containing protein n=1 Tax=Orbilia blumenaviensis TaxID=1796055 RepID=A0AAV9UXN0_9PEZI
MEATEALLNLTFDSSPSASGESGLVYDGLLDSEPNFDLEFLGVVDVEMLDNTVDPTFTLQSIIPSAFPSAIFGTDELNSSSPDPTPAPASVSHILDKTSTPPSRLARQGPGGSTEDAGKQRNGGHKRKVFKNYPCTICHFKTSNLRGLGTHMRDSHGMRAFKCNHCETRVARHDNLESHRKHCGALAPAPKSPVPQTQVKSPVAPVVNSPKRRPAKRQRVSVLNLQPVPLKQLPQPTIPHESQEAIFPATSSPQNGLPNSQPQLEDSESPVRENDTNKVLNINIVEATADIGLPHDGLRSELERALRELEETKLERDAWRKLYLQEKQILPNREGLSF